jgi:hypothetical protein
MNKFLYCNQCAFAHTEANKEYCLDCEEQGQSIPTKFLNKILGEKAMQKKVTNIGKFAQCNQCTEYNLPINKCQNCIISNAGIPTNYNLLVFKKHIHKKLFICVWNNFYTKPGIREVGIDFFNDEMGYHKDDVELISKLEVNDYLELEGQLVIRKK